MKAIFESKKATMAFFVIILSFALLIVEVIVGSFPVPIDWLLALIMTAVGTFQIGQGIADAGKEKAKVMTPKPLGTKAVQPIKKV